MEIRLSKSALFLWQARLFAAFLLIFVVLSYFTASYSFFVYIVLALGILLLLAQFVYLPLLFSSYKICFKHSAVIIEKGVLIKTTHVMPDSKMIYAETFTTPLSKLMGLTALTLKAARSFLFIPELPAKSAAEFLLSIEKGEEP